MKGFPLLNTITILLNSIVDESYINTEEQHIDDEWNKLEIEDTNVILFP